MADSVEIVPSRKYGIPAKIEKFYAGKDSSGVDGLLIEGYASTNDLDRSGEIVEPSAFEKSLAEFMANPVVTYMHDWLQPIGKVVQAGITPTGLWVKVFISNAAEKLIALIKEGILRGFSIGYQVVEEKMIDGVLHLLQVELLEIAVVTIPANPATLFRLAKAFQDGADVVKIKQLYREELHRIEEEKYIEIVDSGRDEIEICL